MIGADQITSFDGGSPEEDLAKQLYEEFVQAELGSFDWNFAKKTLLLSRNTAAPTNSDKWDASYRIDTAFITVRSVWVNGSPIEYEIQENAVLCNASVDDAVYMEGITRPDEGSWPPYFQAAMIFKLAMIFAGSLSRDGQLVAAIEQQYSVQWRKAKAMDSQSMTSPALRTSRLVGVRRGAGRGFFYGGA
jgi:hypothetical protein